MRDAVRNLTRRSLWGKAFACWIVLQTSACERAPAPPPPPLPAVLTTVVRARPEPALSRRGSVSAGARLRLGFNAAGVIAAIAVKTGDTVHEGHVLARLETTDAVAGLRAARAAQVRALRDVRIAERLSASGAASSNQLDEARSALEIAEANLAVAAEALAQRQLRSPIGGTVLERVAEPGETLAPGMPVLVVESTRRLVVKLGVNEREVPRVTPGMAVSLVAEGNATRFPATVTSVAPAPGADGLYAVEVAPVAGAALPLLPGALVTVGFDEDAGPTHLRVPLDAIVYREDKAGVFAVVTEGGASRAVLHEVTVDRWDGKDALVRAPLADGDAIVREGAYFLQDGQAIRVLAPEAGDAAELVRR
jgi:RND family efflux transporter MFP subunit